MKLNCEKHTEAMRKRILAAFHARYGVRKVKAIYEHGQWWIDQPGTGAQWAAVDATGPNSVQGFSFERVSIGDES